MGNDNPAIMRNHKIEFDHTAAELGSLAERLNGIFRIECTGSAMRLNFERHAMNRTDEV
jgi:hypothetical protein